MSTLTARLKLLKAASTDAVDVVAQIDNNFDILDSLLPNAICTSATRPATPFQGQHIYETDTGLTYFYTGAAWKQLLQSNTTETLTNKTFDATNTFNGVVNPPYTTSFKNRLINGSFDVWQRGTPITATGGVNAYTSDRWLMQSGTGATNVCTRVATTLGATAGQSKYSFSWNRSVAGSADSTLSQRVEGVQSFAGQTVTVSGWMTGSGASINFKFRLIQNFGTGGAPSGAVTVYTSPTPITATVTRTRFSATIPVTSITGKTLGTNGDDYLSVDVFREFGDATGATGTLILEDLAIELGPVATDIERIPVAETYRRCLRYYYRLTGVNNDRIGTGNYNSTTSAIVFWQLPETMRAAPAYASSAAGVLSCIGATSSAASANAVGAGANANGMQLNLTVAAVTAGQGCLFYFNAAGWLEANAEL